MLNVIVSESNCVVIVKMSWGVVGTAVSNMAEDLFLDKLPK